MELAEQFVMPSCVILKHGNPCGVSLGKTQSKAYKKALSNDPNNIEIYSNIALAYARGRDFKNTTGDTGGFQKKFKVYGRDKKNCKRLKCLGIIDKIIQSNRSTFYCKICQK